MNDIDEPAFPTKEPLSSDVLGMSLRDYFAAKAMPSFIVNGAQVADAASAAYEIADAMLAARAKP